jgi:hypothetical protein
MLALVLGFNPLTRFAMNRCWRGWDCSGSSWDRATVWRCLECAETICYSAIPRSPRSSLAFACGEKGARTAEDGGCCQPEARFSDTTKEPTLKERNPMKTVLSTSDEERPESAAGEVSTVMPCLNDAATLGGPRGSPSGRQVAPVASSDVARRVSEHFGS